MMELYNSLINETKALLESKSAKVWDYDAHGLWKDTGMSELVLQKDAAFELGASGKGSANYVLFTSNAELVNKSTRSFSGARFFGELKGDCDFARVVLLRVGVLDEDDEAVYRTLKDIEFSKYHVYPRATWSACPRRATASKIRVSKDALRHGISFKSIGMNYIHRWYKKDANVISATVIFMTDPSMSLCQAQGSGKGNPLTSRVLLPIFFEGLPTDCSSVLSRISATKSKE